MQTLTALKKHWESFQKTKTYEVLSVIGVWLWILFCFICFVVVMALVVGFFIKFAIPWYIGLTAAAMAGSAESMAKLIVVTVVCAVLLLVALNSLVRS